MKTLKNLFAATVLFIAAHVAAQPREQQPQSLTFAENTHNFGDIEQNKPVTHDFTFTNTSGKAVTITNVKPSCGCTAPEYPKTAIKPGETAVVTARFDAQKAGSFTKTLTVTTDDTDQSQTLYIKGKVIEAPVSAN